MEDRLDNFKSGFIALVGRPNVGKSTILNKFLGQKISIISSVPQTTRHQIRGILTQPHAQLVFVDTPGIHSFNDHLALHLNVIAQSALPGCDLVLYIVDLSRAPAHEEQKIMELLIKQDIKVVMALNKLDVGTEYINSYIDLWKRLLGEQDIKNDPLIYYVPVSAQTGKNMDTLLNVLCDNIPQQHPFYDDHTTTDFPTQFRIADIVREKLFLQLQKELPHSIAVEVIEIKEKKEKKSFISVSVNIYVNRESQKRIVVGKGGSILKSVGTQARKELQEIFDKKVFLQLWVKVVPDWQEKPRILKELGYE